MLSPSQSNLQRGVISILKEIRIVDDARGIVQVTVADTERWYIREAWDLVTGLPTHEFAAAVTWITNYYHKGLGFLRWMADKGWDQAEAIRAAAGSKGSNVHQAIGDLLAGKTVAMDAPYRNPHTEQAKPLTLEEYEALLHFQHFYAAAHPHTHLHEHVVWSEEHSYAGTLDWLCWIDAEQLDGIQGSARGWWLIDFKTSSEVWPEAELQVSAYRHALPDETLPDEARLSGVRLGILQVGYRKNKRGWKLTEVKDRFDLFLAVKQIWARETEGVEVFRAEYPLAISLPLDGQPTPASTAALPKRRGRPKKAAQESML